MVDSQSTADFGSVSASVLGGRDEVLALVVAWAPFEPERVGEVVLFEPNAGAQILGRGDPGGTANNRALLRRQRPGTTSPTGPLSSPGLSREQLRIRVEADRLRIQRTGKCPIEVDGATVDECTLEPGNTLLLRGQMLLLCTRRPWTMEALRHASLAHAPVFGAADRFGIVGESPSTWRLRERIAWTAAADEHTLLLGGSGSGKELCARAVHELSSRAKGSFVARNAATIPESLVDAELFGNVKGYPNPGMPERTGLVGAAHQGTLFLDEIAEMPLEIQANLLRVLDEGGEYHALGASTARRSDLRLIGATNRDATALKHDLLARLVVRLEVPGLDERREDVPLLIRHLLARVAEKSPHAMDRFIASTGQTAGPRIAADLVTHLLLHSYETNIRELHALLWQAMAGSSGNVIGWSETPKARESAPPKQSAPPLEEAAHPKEERRAEPTADEIRATLARLDGNILHTARALGLSSRYVLYRLMRRHGIDPDAQ